MILNTGKKIKAINQKVENFFKEIIHNQRFANKK